MQLTPNQKVAIDKLTGASKKHLLAIYHRQNGRAGGGQEYRGRGGPGKTKRSNARIQSMPMAQSMPRGVMPANANAQSWSQTPASSNIIAPRGFGYYDAFTNDAYSAATHMSIGPATPIVANTICNSGLRTRDPITMDVTYPDGQMHSLEAGMLLMVVYPATCDTQAKLYSCSNTDPVRLGHEHEYNSPNLQSARPDNAIATRCSFRIRNWTQHVGTGGIVRILRCTTGLSLDCSSAGRTTNGDLAVLAEEVRNHARTRIYSGEELCESHQKNLSVVDQSRSTWFMNWNSLHKVADTPWAVGQGWPQGGTGNPPTPQYTIGNFSYQLHDPAYTPIIILFEPFTAAVNGQSIGNSYEVNIRSQYLAHYAQGSMLANMAICPKATPDTLNKHKDKEEAQGSTMHNVGRFLSNAASWAWDHRSQIGAGVAAGQRALGYVPKAMPMLML